jgi:hypothetical protein
LQSVTEHTSETVQSAQQYQHKHIQPLAAQDVVLFIFSFVILALAAGAGIGKAQTAV